VSAQRAFALVIGSGFTGALLSWILQRHDRQVVLIDRAVHPRFAIGESSTPTADFLLAYLSDRWNLPEIGPLSAFGTWQSHYPELRCGLKRGFSYFGHTLDQEYVDDNQHSRSLLVAASATDHWSDTHWYREDIDMFFAKRAQSAGVRLHESTEVLSAQWDSGRKLWTVRCGPVDGVDSDTGPMTIETDWLIDASGSGNGTAPWCGHEPDDAWMRTRSSAIFGHFDSVASFSQMQHDYQSECKEFFDSDHAAQHHVVDDGWYWMLRFLDGRTSVGKVLAFPKQRPDTASSRSIMWRDQMHRYPSIQRLMANAKLVAPHDRDGIAELGFVPRMSRCRSAAVGDGWLLMPLAYGFVDPLHSSGIAHALSGVSRVADCLLGPQHLQREKLSEYANGLRTEIEWIDTLVSGCYQGLPSYEYFAAYTAYYFAATIAFENHLAKDPTHWPEGYLCCKNQGLRHQAEVSWQESSNDLSKASYEKYVSNVRSGIAPWNTVGLLDPIRKNRLNHTAPPKRARYIVE
jgi:FADH2 O2-dependent halogenase